MKKRQALALVLTLLLLMTVWPLGVVGAALSPNAPYLRYAASSGIMTAQDILKPDQPVTRAELAGYLCRMASVKLPKTAKSSFKDVLKNNPQLGAIEFAVKSKWIQPLPDKTFGPAVPAKRAEFAAALMAVAGAGIPAVQLPEAIKDVQAPAAKPIAAVLDSGMMTPNKPDAFEPDAVLTRVQAARGLAILRTTAPRFRNAMLQPKLILIKGTVNVALNGKKFAKVVKPVVCVKGTVLKTTPKSEARLDFPDGSSLLLKENTTLTFKEMNGRAVIAKDGRPLVAVDNLQIGLSEGRMYGALATNTAPATISGSDSWWKQASAQKIKVKVDMPWGVAGIRGTIWMNEVQQKLQITNVVDGGVQVSTKQATVTVMAGKQSVIAGVAAPPSAPAPIPQAQLAGWKEAKPWMQETVTNMTQSAPVVPVEVTGPQPEQPAPPTVDELLKTVQSVIDTPSMYN